MATYRVQTSLQDDSGLPRDQYVNVIHVGSIEPTNSNFTAWCGGIFQFYEGIRSYLSPVVAQFGGITKIYTVGAPIGTPPVHVQNMDFAGPLGGVALPGEVASVLSYKGLAHAGWRLQSTRGRMYIGPLNTGAMETVNNGVAVKFAFRTECTTRGAALAATIKANGGTWVVHSKLHNADTPVTSMFMNDEFDTVRTRGKRESARTVVAIP